MKSIEGFFHRGMICREIQPPLKVVDILDKKFGIFFAGDNCHGEFNNSTNTKYSMKKYMAKRAESDSPPFVNSLSNKKIRHNVKLNISILNPITLSNAALLSEIFTIYCNVSGWVDGCGFHKSQQHLH